jgi:hypothetical protein
MATPPAPIVDASNVKPVILPGYVNVLKNLVYGGAAGFVGSLCTFPIDTAKTRLQEQVKLVPGQPSPFKGGPYTGIFNCLKIMSVKEGPLSFYKGLPVQLIGIMPEKALKLSVNDFLRYQTRNKDGSIDLLWEGISGGLAGFAQVIITSPMEMFKIRMQLQNKKPEAERLPAMGVMKKTFEGGLPAIYRGAAATLMRDVPFSIIYFPLFSNLKLGLAGLPSTGWSGAFRRPNSDAIVDGNKRVNLLGTFLCGLVAGSVAAFTVTPADVIKTRLQSEGGVEKFKNIRTAIRMTYAEGGIRPFFNGATGRLILIGPLFGVVLATYEFMPRILPL